MTLLGLHLIDWAVIALYFVGMIYIGGWARRKIKNSQDFYQGGRSFGKVLFAFLNFGNITSSDQATGVTREIYRQGLSGLWFQNIVLFITPFYWFSSILQRRTRYIAPGDIYLHRFESKLLAGLFAIYVLFFAIYGGGMGFLLTGKTMKALMIKPAAEYTLEEKQSVEGFQRYKALEEKLKYQPLTEEENKELVLLREKLKRGEIAAYISYLDLITFYFLYAAIVGAYTIMGGLFAAVVTDIIQGLLILFLSLVLIPIGLIKLGGFAGLHANVPDYMFELFGSATTSEYTWYFVMAMFVVNLIGLPPRSFTVGGSAKDDNAARIGMVVGAFSKRFFMIGWALTGLIAVALYSGTLSDPTMVWGHMTRDLLGYGFIGLMVSAILAANMSSIDAQSIEWGAAFSKNILLPLYPNTSEKKQVLAGRLVIFVVLFSSIYFAYKIDDIFVMFKYILSIGTVIGPPLWLVYFWRRLTTKAVVIQMVLTILTTIVIPNVGPTIGYLRSHPTMTVRTREQVIEIETKAIEEDVNAGRAEYVGQMIKKKKIHPPAGIFFEQVVRENPDDLNSPLVGKGAFRNQIFYLYLIGIPVKQMTKAQLATASFIFDVIFPFIILFGVSLITRKNSERILREFYGAVHTPVVADKDEDARRVQEAIDRPDIVEARKLFPGTNWEFWKPTKWDIWGFVLSWVMVAVIIFLYIFVMKIGA